MNMLFREAKSADILQIQVVRNAVNENKLSDPALVSDNDVHEFITNRGKGWVCEINENIVGFAIADLKDNNIWALFVHPDHEKKSIGKTLHDKMMNWYFGQGKNHVWLSTGSNTRAESFYRKAGWKETGLTSKGEIEFEMKSPDWESIKNNL
jgi:GNAT superfamily N-acetyltransferase